MKIDSFVAGSPSRVLIPHHVLRLQHFFHELLFLVHDLEVTPINVGKLLLHDAVGHAHSSLSRLENRIVAPQSVHREDLRVGLLGGRLHVGVQAYYRRSLRDC